MGRRLTALAHDDDPLSDEAIEGAARADPRCRVSAGDRVEVRRSPWVPLGERYLADEEAIFGALLGPQGFGRSGPGRPII